MIPGVKARNLNCNLISAEKATDEFHQNKRITLILLRYCSKMES